MSTDPATAPDPVPPSAPATLAPATPAQRRVAPPVDVALLAVTVVAVVAGVALRFAPRSGLWLDEALTVNIASLPLGDITEALRRDGHPPLFYVLQHGWIALGGDSDWWVRSLAGIISLLGLPLTYLAGRRLGDRSGAGPLGGRRTGLIALSVMALLPYGIRYGAEARMYSLAITLVLAGYLLVDDLLAGRSAGRRRLVVALGATLVAAALLWTHYWSMWLLAAVGLVALWRAWRARSAEQRSGARLVAGALVAGGVLFLPWVPVLLYQSANTGTPWGQRFGPASVIVVSVVDFAGSRHGAAQLLSYALVALIVAAATVRIAGSDLVIGRPVAPRVRGELVVIGLTMGVGWATAFATNNTFASRYVAVIFPLFVVSVAAGIALARSPRVTVALLAVVVGLSAFGVVGEIRYSRTQTEPVVADIAADIEANDVDAAVVIACPDQLGVALQRQIDQQLDDGTEVIPYPAAGDPRFVDWVDYGERNAASDPVQFVEDLGERLPPQATLYVVSNTTYRTFEGKCEQLMGALGADRVATVMVPSAPDDHEEPANLLVLRPQG